MRFDRVDQMYQAYLNTHQDVNDRWLLEQTLYTGVSRRACYPYLQIPQGARVLDLGTGFGALALDLATTQPLEIYAVDADPDKLAVARTVADQVGCMGSDTMLGELYFQMADIYALPYDDGYFDYVTGRFLFQHLADPAAAVAEIYRVVKPGGVACLIDIDDNLAIIYPPTPGFSTLHEAFSKLQQSYGGDREMGRKLSVYLQHGGFTHVQAHVYMQSQHSLQRKDDFAHQFVVRRFVNTRQTVIEQGIMSEEQYDEALRQFSQSDGSWEFTSSGQVIALGQKPVGV